MQWLAALCVRRPVFATVLILSLSVVGGFSFYERAEIKDMISYLKVIQNPDDTISLLRVINFPPRGVGVRLCRDSGQRAEHRQIRVGAGVPAMGAGKTGAAVVDAREFAGEIVEIGLGKAVGIAGEVEGPAHQPGGRLVAGRGVDRHDLVPEVDLVQVDMVGLESPQ